MGPIGEMVGVEYSGKEAKGASGVIRKKVRGEKAKVAKAAPAAATASDGSSAAAPAASAPVKAGKPAEALPRPGQGSFDKNGDFVLPAGPRDPMIPISEDNTPRRENSPVHTTFFETGQDPTERGSNSSWFSSARASSTSSSSSLALWASSEVSVPLPGSLRPGLRLPLPLQH